ncbi:MAG: SAM-dependent chlorinase/fluorinase [Planctomycetota bacterium]
MRSGIVTLLTDFGVQEAYVGVMKGVLHARSSALRAVVDLTHEVAPQDVEQARFHLENAWHWFPEGSVHVVVVDPGVGTDRAIAVAEHGGHVFVAPDNGLMRTLLDPTDEVHRLDLSRYPVPSATFHGRDLFAPAAAELVDGARPRDLGPRIELELAPERRNEAAADGSVAGRVVHVDRFGNLITDIAASVVGADPARCIAEIAGLRVRMVAAYGAAEPGDLLALVDSYGAVEIAVRDGDAARRLGVGRGAPVKLVLEP